MYHFGSVTNSSIESDSECDQSTNIRQSYRWMFDTLLKPIEWGISTLLRPFNNTIRAVVARINPFGSIMYIDHIHDQTIGKIDAVVNNVTNNTVTELLNFAKSDKFEEISGRLVDGIAIALRALFEFISMVLVQASKNTEFFDQLIANAGDALEAFKTFFDEERKANKSIRLGDVLLKIKASSIDGPSAEIDSYLSNSVGSSPYTYIEYGTEDKIKTFINDQHSDEYEFVLCHLFPEKDVTSHYFQRGSQLSWLNASLAAILQHKQIVETVKSFGIGSNEYHEFGNGFVPQVSSDGKCTFELYRWLMNDDMTTYTVDTRLPVKKTALQLPADNLGNMLPTIFNYVREKIFAFKHESFSLATHGSVSWAMLEKVAITKLNVTRDEKVLVGSGMYWLDGLMGSRFKKQTNGNFELQIPIYLGVDFRMGDENFLPVSGYENLSSDFIMDSMREWILSLDQVEALQAVARNEEDALDDDAKNDIVEKMKNVFMHIIVRTDGVAHPIICHDIDENKSILFSTGTILQPLMDLNDVEEIWNFSLKPSHAKNQPNPTNAKNQSKSSPKSVDVASLIDVMRLRGVENIGTYQRKSRPRILDRLGSSFIGCMGGMSMKSSSKPLFSEVRIENPQLTMTPYDHLLDDDGTDWTNLVLLSLGAAPVVIALGYAAMKQIALLINRKDLFQEGLIVHIKDQRRLRWLYALHRKAGNGWYLKSLPSPIGDDPPNRRELFTTDQLEKARNEGYYQTHTILAEMEIFDSERNHSARRRHRERQRTQTGMLYDFTLQMYSCI